MRVTLATTKAAMTTLAIPQIIVRKVRGFGAKSVFKDIISIETKRASQNRRYRERKSSDEITKMKRGYFSPQKARIGSRYH